MDAAPLPAVLLAGGRDRGELADATGQPIRGLIPIHGRPMIAWVLDALASSRQMGPTVVVGPDALASTLGDIPLIPEGADLLANIVAGLAGLAGLAAHGGDSPVLILTTDIPFLTPAALDDFITRAGETGADLCYPIIPKTANDAQFPGMKRTYVPLREGRVTGGNMIWVRSEFFRRMEPLVAEAYALRKQPFALARRVGFGVAPLLLARRLTIAEVERRVGRLLNGSVRGILTEYAEIGADVDKPDDLRLAERLLGGA